MGRKNKQKKTTWKERRENNKKIKKEDDGGEFVHFAYSCPPMETYYREIFQEYFKDDSEFQQCLNYMKERLPVTFRINENVPNYQNFLKTLKDSKFIANLLAQGKQEAKPEGEEEAKIETKGDDEGADQIKAEKKRRVDNESDYIEEISLKNVKWYPQELLWQLNTFRQALKKSEGLKKLHKYIQKASDSGLISRQELVSMLPPLFLDVQSTDLVFDMCAAPGSKTAQLIQTMYRDEAQGKGMTQGGVIANDADYTRAYMLIHQIKRMNAAGIAVVNHGAQHFPTLNIPNPEPNQFDSKLYFDKILADVPCSGDGAIRKLPNRWSNWSTKDGISLHHLQILILQRALQITKIGGLIVYSTCSLNPTEDEAVLTEVFRRCNSDAFELIDIHNAYPGLIARRGLLKWKVYEETEEYKAYAKRKKDRELQKQKKKEGAGIEEEEEKPFDTDKIFNKYSSISDLPKDYNGIVGPTLFPDDEETMKNVYKIHHSMRILPHDQNTGGFFIALIRKKNHVVFSSKTNTKNEPTEEQIKEILKETEGADVEEGGQQADPKEAQIIEEEKKEADGEDEGDSGEADEEKIPAEPNNTPADPIDIEEPKPKKIEISEEDMKQEGKKAKKNTYVKDKKPQFVYFDSPDWKGISEFYGIDESKLKPLTIQLNEGDKNVYLITPGIKKLLDCDTKGLVKKLNMGVKLFVRNKESLKDNSFPYRICQDAIFTAFPYITKRKIKVSGETFKEIIKKRNVKFSDIKDTDLQENLSKIDSGALVLYTQNEGNIKDFDCVVGLKFKASLSLMISRELGESLMIRYIESEAAN